MHHVTYRDFGSIPILHFRILLYKETPISLGLAMCQVKDIFSTLYEQGVSS